jgi:hypothetical protein
MNEKKKKIMIYPDIPGSMNVQAALGVLVVRHGHLEYILRMTIKSLCGLSIHDALIDTNKQGAKRLRERIEKEAESRLGQCAALEKLLKLLRRSWKASDERNLYVHNVWARELDGPLKIQSEDFSWMGAPTAQELERLSDEIKDITDELNEDRLHGSLKEAIKKQKSKSSIEI